VKTNYRAHDSHYSRQRRNGSPGWGNSENEYTEWQAECAQILRRGHAPATGRLLDLGCGAGNMTLWLARQGYEAHGIDIAPTAIDWARERAGAEQVRAVFDVGDAVTLAGYGDSSFDFVFDSHCLHCIIGDDRATLLANVHRVLRPGGYLLVQTMCGPVALQHAPAGHSQHYDAQTRCLVYDGVAVRYFGEPRHILDEVARSSFDIVRHELTPLAPGRPNADLTIEAVKPVR
jgi:ubiquinone/menaquinone biosynthesis C-methylase UbiE